MNVQVLHGRHDATFDALVDRGLTELHHEPAILSAFHRDWHSITVSDGERRFHNSVARRPIGDSGWYDVEPWLGYAGPVTTSADPAFLLDAIAAYSGACRDLDIVAELIRFSPLLGNADVLAGTTPLVIVARKPVVIVPCPPDDEAQTALFSPACRRRLRRGLSDLTVRLLDKDREIDVFRRIYEASMERAGAGVQWFFDDAFYERLRQLALCEIITVWHGSELACACLVGFHRTGAHYMLAANASELPAGAGERLVYEATREAARRGIGRLMLGGGVTDRPDDPLLRFKRRFAATSSTFVVGGLVHDPAVFDRLVVAAVARRPEIADSPFFLKYRL